MNFDLDKVKGTCRALSKVRASLCGYEDLSGDSLMKIAQHRAKSFIHDKGFLNKGEYDSQNKPFSICLDYGQYLKPVFSLLY